MNDPFGVEAVSKAVTYDKKQGKKLARSGAQIGAGLGGAVGAATAIGPAMILKKPGLVPLNSAHKAVKWGLGGAALGGAAGFKKKKVSKSQDVLKGLTLNRKEAKKDALNVGATGAATGATLGALTGKDPLYRMKKGKLVPSKFPRGAGKGALALGAVGATSGLAANLGYKKKKK